MPVHPADAGRALYCALTGSQGHPIEQEEAVCGIAWDQSNFWFSLWLCPSLLFLQHSKIFSICLQAQAAPVEEQPLKKAASEFWPVSLMGTPSHFDFVFHPKILVKFGSPQVMAGPSSQSELDTKGWARKSLWHLTCVLYYICVVGG